ncbi:hypothetical protein HPB50_000619 [Hyalomma asiaticum]|uniref:Uncharacterized protein n=1 Tax=Hyalomma asiaticum TaxID=266040 RepID=A0ACB7SIE3_HYAAI|nr:hypothetical protein HPB50_000619 [Hyalomma asiaticum]
MAGSQRAATAVAFGRGTPSVSVPKDYRIVLPTVSTGDAMKRAVVLHCDILGRPYRIEDFRKPLQDAGVIKDVAVIGAYQMSHDGSVSGHQSATVVDAGDDVRQAPGTANADGVDSEHSREESAREQRDARSVSQIPEAAGAALASQRLRQIEASLGVGAKKKARSAARVRASSLSRGDADANF